MPYKDLKGQGSPSVSPYTASPQGVESLMQVGMIIVFSIVVLVCVSRLPIGDLDVLQGKQKEGANWRDGQRTLAKASGTLPRLVYMGIPHID